MDTWITILVLGSSGWVYGDAKNIGVKKGQVKGLANMSPTGWFVACLLLWVVAFPFYLIKRPVLKRANESRS